MCILKYFFENVQKTSFSRCKRNAQKFPLTFFQKYAQMILKTKILEVEGKK